MIYKSNSKIKKTLEKIKFFTLKNKLEIFLFFFFLLIFVIYSWDTITNSQCPFHLDSHETWIFSKNLIQNKGLIYSDPLSELFEHKIFYHFGGHISNNKLYPIRTYGIIFLTYFGLLLGYKVPFYLISLLGTIGVIFYYLFTKNIFNKKIALISTVFFSLSYPMINWSNQLINNVPAFSLFITGLYFASNILTNKNNRLSNYILSALFFSLTSWMRYEYLIFILFLIPWIYKTRKSIKLKYFIISILVFILLLTPIFFINYYLHKSPFTFGFIEARQIPVKLSDKIVKHETSKNGVLNKIINTFLWIYNNFLLVLIRFDFIILINNLKYYLYDIFPGLIIFSILGYLVIFKEREKNKLNFVIFSLISLIFQIFTIIPKTLLRSEDIIIGGPIPRYFLLIYCFVILISAFFILSPFKKIIKIRKIYYIITTLLITITILNTSSLMIGSSVSILTHNKKKQISKINLIIKDFPNNSIIVGDRRFFLHGITERKTLDLNKIEVKEKKENCKIATNYIKTLLNLNYPIYIIEKNYLNLTNHIQKNENDLIIEKVISEGYFEIYKVFYREK